MDKFTICWLTFCLLTLFCCTEKEEEISTIPVVLTTPDFFLEDKPTRELVMEACEYYNIQHPEIVVAQSILETGMYRSEVCIKYNNLFGLYNSSKKEYYKFDHWTSSVKAYYDMIQYRYKEGDYYQWLQNIGYAEDSLYIPKVKNVENKYVFK